MIRGRNGGWLLPSSVIAGALVSHLFTGIPPTWLLCLVTAAALILIFNTGWRPLALALIACCWCLWSFHFRLLDRLDPLLEGKVIPIKGTVTSIPVQSKDYIRFRFETQAGQWKNGIPQSLIVYWYRDWPELSLGQQWQLQLKLRPPWGSVNFQGSDKERWLFAQGVGGLGSVRSGVLLSQGEGLHQLVGRVREAVMQQINLHLPNQQQQGIVRALATADRSGIEDDDRRLLNLTGTSHLLAISGLHIGLAAAGGMWLGRLVTWFMPVMRMGRIPLLFSLACGLLTAVSYAALAGFGVSTMRATVMLACGLFALAMNRSIHPFRAWLIALAVILVLDPFAPLGAGFWFSFLAVAALLVQFAPRLERISWWKTLLLAQSAVFLVLFPVSAGWFQSFSPVGFVANLIAIPWVSLLVVPFVLAGIAGLALSATLAAASWTVAGMASSALMYLLEFFGRVQGELTTLPMPATTELLLALAGAFLLLLPRGITGKWCAAFLFAPLFLPPAERAARGTVMLEVLDAGQGTAIVLNLPDRSLLYDSGPGNGKGMDIVRGTVAPALDRWGGKAPERIVISHGDMDHAGGLRTLIDRYPNADYRVNRAGESGCSTPMQWWWEDVKFDVLHPDPALPYLGNDSSCVISVRTPVSGILLSGDISRVVENRLLLENIRPHAVLLVPHHGSMTSSSPAFIDAVQPKVAIATASLGNRFDFPRGAIRKRYLAAGTKFWSTGECGALRVILKEDGTMQAESARRIRNRIWRWPAALACP